MILDTAWTNTPAGYPARRSATSAWPLCICSFGHRALRASSIVFLSSLTRSLTLALLAKTPVRTEVQDWTTPPARRGVVVLHQRPNITDPRSKWEQQKFMPIWLVSAESSFITEIGGLGG